ILRRRGPEPVGRRAAAGDGAVPREGGGWRPMGPDPARLRAGRARALLRPHQTADSDRRRDLAVALVPPRGVPPQRGAGHHGARLGEGPHARRRRARASGWNRHVAIAAARHQDAVRGGVPDAVLRALRSRGGSPRRLALTTMADLHGFGGAERAGPIREGVLSPVDLVPACLKRIDAVDGVVKAWVRVDRDAALRVAEQRLAEARQGRWLGPLHGIPVAL